MASTASDIVTFHVPFTDGEVDDCTCCARIPVSAIVADELAHVKGVNSVFVEERSGMVRVDYRPSEVAPSTLARILSDLGCPPGAAQGTNLANGPSPRFSPPRSNWPVIPAARGNRMISGRTMKFAVISAATLAAAILLTGCVGSRAPTAGSSNGAAPNLQHDLRLATYQGESTLGQGETHLSRAFQQGKPVVLNFFAGLCPPCRAEMPGFQKVVDEFGGQFVLVGVDVGPFTGLGDSTDARRLLVDLRIQYPAAGALDSSTLRDYGVVNMPTTIFFRPDGTIAERQPGLVSESQLRSAVRGLLGAG